MNSKVYYQNKLDVRFYDLFTGDAALSGPVKGDVDFYIENAREFGGPVRYAVVDQGVFALDQGVFARGISGGLNNCSAMWKAGSDSEQQSSSNVPETSLLVKRPDQPRHRINW